MILDLSVDTLILRASPRLKELIATIPGWRFSGMDGDMGVWTADAAWAVAVATRAVLGDEMQVTEAASDWAQSQRGRITWILALKGLTSIEQAQQSAPDEVGRILSWRE